MTTRQQQYASSAHQKVEALQSRDNTFKTRYGSIAHRLPVLIRSAGLAQALAYVDARGKDEGQQLLLDLASVLNEPDRQTLIAKSRTTALLEYMYLTDQCLDALLWFKRFAQTILKVEPGEGDPK